MATAGESGLAATDLAGDLSLGDRRLDELTASAHVIGCARVVMLGYGDSGLRRDGEPRPVAVRARRCRGGRRSGSPRSCARRSADVLTTYDPAGGYGHPDHVQVHRVGVRAAEIAGTPVVLEATADRTVLQRVVRVPAPDPVRAARPLHPVGGRGLHRARATSPTWSTSRDDRRRQASRHRGPRQPVHGALGRAHAGADPAAAPAALSAGVPARVVRRAGPAPREPSARRHLRQRSDPIRLLQADGVSRVSPSAGAPSRRCRTGTSDGLELCDEAGQHDLAGLGAVEHPAHPAAR